MTEELKKSNELKVGGVIDPAESSTLKTPTGSWRSFRPEYLENKCVQCLMCAQACPENAIPVREGKRSETNFNFCKGCGICAQICPVKAIAMKPEEKKI